MRHSLVKQMFTKKMKESYARIVYMPAPSQVLAPALTSPAHSGHAPVPEATVASQRHTMQEGHRGRRRVARIDDARTYGRPVREVCDRLRHRDLEMASEGKGGRPKTSRTFKARRWEGEREDETQRLGWDVSDVRRIHTTQMGHVGARMQRASLPFTVSGRRILAHHTLQSVPDGLLDSSRPRLAYVVACLSFESVEIVHKACSVDMSYNLDTNSVNLHT